MVDNQHRIIKGYRDLSKEEIDLMNQIKDVGSALNHIIERVVKTEGVDARWVAIAKTDLQKGIMALVRSVAKPESF